MDGENAENAKNAGAIFSPAGDGLNLDYPAPTSHSLCRILSSTSFSFIRKFNFSDQFEVK
jgi:hypothetical protein